MGVSLFTLWLPANYLWTTVWKEDMRPWNNSVELSPAAYQTVPVSQEEEEDGSRMEFPFHSNDQRVTMDAPGMLTNEEVWTHAQHRAVAMQIAPVWFLANWSYNASLAYTSITSSTVLASTGSLFTFIFAVCFRDEKFTFLGLAGVLLGVTGSFLTAWQDRDVENDMQNGNLGKNLVGDLLGLLSAIGYGGYAVQTRLLCPHNEQLYSMQVLLGYIGFYNMLILSPVAITLVWTSYHNHNGSLTWIVVGFLVVKGLFDNVLSDYLWLRAVILTSATVATVGLGLTIPFAFLSDLMLGKVHVITGYSVSGAVAVLLGFCLVNLGSQRSNVEQISQTTQSGSAVEAEPYLDHDEIGEIRG